MANRIQFRRDTLANWQAANPILMEGELALISTDPAKPGVYDSKKVGDGIHHFNDLEMLGYECLQELGDSTQFPVSQKVVTDNLSKLDNVLLFNDRHNLNNIIKEIYIGNLSTSSEKDIKIALFALNDTSFALNIFSNGVSIAYFHLDRKPSINEVIVSNDKKSYVVLKSLISISKSDTINGIADIYFNKIINLNYSPIISSYILNSLEGNVVAIINDFINSNGYLFGGFVSPSDSPKTSSNTTVYLATEPGVYSNFANNINIATKGLYLIYNLNGGWYHKTIKCNDRTKYLSANSLIKELYIKGAKSSDNLYISSIASNVENNQIEIIISKDGTPVSSYYKTTTGEFNKVVKFDDNYNSGIIIYAVFNKVNISAISGLVASNGLLLESCYTLDNNGEITGFLIGENTKIINTITPKQIQWTISDNSINKYVKEFYIENASELFTNGLYIERLVLRQTAIRFWLRDLNKKYQLKISVNFNKYHFDNEADGSWKYYDRSNAITPIYLVDETTNLSTRIGYIRFNFGYGEFSISGTHIQLDLEKLSNIDNSPKIKQMLSDDRQIVLLGDSHFGYPHPNILCDVIQGLTNIKTFNLGFGGCRMAWRTSDGSNPYDVYTFPEIVDALINQTFNKQEAQINIGMGYSLSVADLKAIDTTKPIQILLHFGANDATGGTELGNIWQDDSNFDMTSETSVNSKLASLNRQLFNEAFLYGLIKLYYNFTTKINIQVLDEGWRWYETENGKRTIIWNYTNSIGKKPQDYIDALKEGCKQVGIRYIDYYNCGIMNAFSLIPASSTNNKTGIGLEGSAHLEPIGHAQFAYWLANQVKTYYL